MSKSMKDCLPTNEVGSIHTCGSLSWPKDAIRGRYDLSDMSSFQNSSPLRFHSFVHSIQRLKSFSYSTRISRYHVLSVGSLLRSGWSRGRARCGRDSPFFSHVTHFTSRVPRRPCNPQRELQPTTLRTLFPFLRWLVSANQNIQHLLMN